MTSCSVDLTCSVFISRNGRPAQVPTVSRCHCILWHLIPIQCFFIISLSNFLCVKTFEILTLFTIFKLQDRFIFNVDSKFQNGFSKLLTVAQPGGILLLLLLSVKRCESLIPPPSTIIFEGAFYWCVPIGGYERALFHFGWMKNTPRKSDKCTHTDCSSNSIMFSTFY